MRSPLNLDPLLNEPLDWRFRAFPEAGIRIGDVPSQRWKLFESGFFFPAMVLKEPALEHNLRSMARFCSERGVAIAPHGKTTMAPQIFARQLSAGAFAITAATAEHARVYQSFGVPRILFANELVRADEARWVAAQLAVDPSFDCLCYVDSTTGVRVLADAMSGISRELGVLIELGTPGGRTGVRTIEDARTLAREVDAAPGLTLRGVAAFEGILGADRAGSSVAAVDAFCDRLAGLARDLSATRDGEFVVSAGGSAYPDRVVERLGTLLGENRKVKIVLRSGCYVTHDDGFYERVSPFASGANGGGLELRPALELWAAVVSRPEPEVAIVGFGKRDAPFDADLPIPRFVRSHAGADMRPAASMVVVKLNDQHAYLKVAPGDPLGPGDLLGFGVSHPCLAFDKWSLLPSVDDDYNVVDAIRTYF